MTAAVVTGSGKGLFEAMTEMGVSPQQLAQIISQRIVLSGEQLTQTMSDFGQGTLRASAHALVDIGGKIKEGHTIVIDLIKACQGGWNNLVAGFGFGTGKSVGGAGGGSGSSGRSSGGGGGAKQQVQQQPNQKQGAGGSVARAVQAARNPNAVTTAPAQPATPPKAAANPGAKPGMV